MTILATLTLSDANRSRRLTDEERRREKLVAKLTEQLALVRAQLAGEEFAIRVTKWKRDEHGVSQPVMSHRRVRPWYWRGGDGQWLINVRYGAKILDLGGGRASVIAGEQASLVGVIEALIAATHGGELDGAVSAVLAFRPTTRSKAKSIGKA